MRKSKFLTRATSRNYMTSPEIKAASARALFRKIKSGAVNIEIGQTYALKNARMVHRDAEARKTTGSTIMLV